VKAMILAAGKGERMRPLTLHTPKPLLEAGGQPLILHQIKQLRAAGFRQLVINHAWLGDKIEARLGDGSAWNVKIDYSPEGSPLETAGGIIRALPLLTQGSDWFLVINGDIWSDFDPRQLTPPSDARALLVLTDNPQHHPEGDFQLMPSGRVARDGPDRLTFAGISLLHRSLFDQLPAGTRKLGPVLRDAMDREQVRGIHHRGHWIDVGTPERLRQLEALLEQEHTRP